MEQVKGISAEDLSFNKHIPSFMLGLPIKIQILHIDPIQKNLHHPMLVTFMGFQYNMKNLCYIFVPFKFERELPESRTLFS